VTLTPSPADPATAPSATGRFRCPKCRGDFAGVDWDGLLGTETTASIACADCGSVYPVIASVPILLRDVRGYLEKNRGEIAFWAGAAAAGAVLAEHGLDLPGPGDFPRREQLTFDTPEIVHRYLLRHLFGRGDVREYLGRVSTGFEADWLLAGWDFEPYRPAPSGPSMAGWNILDLGCATGSALDLPRTIGSLVMLDIHFGLCATALQVRRRGAVPAQLLSHIATLEQSDFLLRRLEERAEERKMEQSYVAVADVFAAPVADEAFDLTFALNLIDMLEDPARFFPAVSRFSRDGGTISTCSPYQWSPKAREALRQLSASGYPRDDLVIRQLLKSAGLEIVHEQRDLPWQVWKSPRDFGTYLVDYMVLEKPRQTGRLQAEMSIS
jgi:SAM-dependent methyltransferase/uncharacterized protein YbaR (Trm112 family)